MQRQGGRTRQATCLPNVNYNSHSGSGQASFCGLPGRCAVALINDPYLFVVNLTKALDTKQSNALLIVYEHSGGAYRAIQEMAAGWSCETETERQYLLAVESFRATTHYALEGDRLTLTGDGVEMRLVRASEQP